MLSVVGLENVKEDSASSNVFATMSKYCSCTLILGNVCLRYKSFYDSKNGWFEFMF